MFDRRIANETINVKEYGYGRTFSRGHPEYPLPIIRQSGGMICHRSWVWEPLSWLGGPQDYGFFILN